MPYQGPLLDCHVLEGFGIYMIGILDSYLCVGGWFLLHVVHSSCNLDM